MTIGFEKVMVEVMKVNKKIKIKKLRKYFLSFFYVYRFYK